jgi:hypothetical protein
MLVAGAFAGHSFECAVKGPCVCQFRHRAALEFYVDAGKEVQRREPFHSKEFARDG